MKGKRRKGVGVWLTVGIRKERRERKKIGRRLSGRERRKGGEVNK